MDGGSRQRGGAHSPSTPTAASPTAGSGREACDDVRSGQVVRGPRGEGRSIRVSSDDAVTPGRTAHGEVRYGAVAGAARRQSIDANGHRRAEPRTNARAAGPAGLAGCDSLPTLGRLSPPTAESPTAHTDVIDGPCNSTLPP